MPANVILRPMAVAIMALSLVGAAPLPTVYAAPAGSRIAGAPDPAFPYNTVLPSGRILAPIGKSVIVGMNALGITLSPDGRYAIVSNDDRYPTQSVSRFNPIAQGGYSLAVVNTATMAVTDVFKENGLSLQLGVAALRDPANPGQTLVMASTGPANTVRFWQLDGAGKLHPDASAPIATQDPGWIALSANRRIAYVVNMSSNSVTAIDIARRATLQSSPVGYFPYAAALAGDRLYVTNPGLTTYAKRPQPVRIPEFANVPFAPAQGSSLTAVGLAPGGDIQRAVASTPMDQAPDGMNNVGGAHPGAIAVSKDGRYAFVCMTNVDRVAVVNLLGIPRVVGGLQLRLFDRSPYGTQPDAIVRSPDGKRLYVALAGMNAIAEIDARNPLKLHRLGLIPTGWFPTGIAVSPSGRYLYVTNAKGIGQEPGYQGSTSPDDNVVWATLQRIDLHKLPLERTTFSALRYLRVAQRPQANPIVPPLRSLQRSSVIKHVVFIMEEDKTYDSMLGDLTDAQGRPYGVGDPSLVSFGAPVTPNLHALAREFGLATNIYADGEDDESGHQFAAAGIAGVLAGNQDPEDYPRAGYIFNSAARASLAYRDYGDLVRLSGYDQGLSPNPKDDDPDFVNAADQNAPTSGLGGLYSLDVPAPLALGGHIDVNYPGWNLRIRDVRRAKEFIRDYTALAQSGVAPDFTYIWLPNDRGGAGPELPPLSEEVADGDRALGMIVDYLSHRPDWNSTAIFITPDDAQGSRDHVSAHRTYAVVVSPYAKRRYTGAMHLSTVSILKTEEELLGLPPLSLGDLLATDMSDFFTSTPDPTPFTAQSAAAPGVEHK